MKTLGSVLQFAKQPQTTKGPKMLGRMRSREVLYNHTVFTKLASIPRWLAVISENRLWQQKEPYRPLSAVALQRFSSLPGLYPKVSNNIPKL